MSLPPLLKHVYNYGTEEVVRRGKRIFHTSGVQLLDVDHLLQQIRFRVRNDVYQNYYTVTISKYNDEKAMAVRCQCPYNLGNICRHEVAALFQLNDMVHSGFFNDTTVLHKQAHTIVRMRTVSNEMVALFTAPASLELATEAAKEKKATIDSISGDTIKASVAEGRKKFPVIIRQNEERYFDTSCTCEETSHPLCRHKATVFIQILKTDGPKFFAGLQNWDLQKNKLLALYGFSLKDDLTGKFEWTYKDGKPFLRVLDPSIKKVAVPMEVETASVPFREPQALKPATTAPLSDDAPADAPELLQLGIVADTTRQAFPYLSFELVAGHPGEEEGAQFTTPIEHLDLQMYVNPARFLSGGQGLLPISRKLQPAEILKYIKKTLPFGDFLSDADDVLRAEEPQPEIRDLAWEYLLPKYQQLLSQFAGYALTFLHTSGGSLSSKSLAPLTFSGEAAQPVITIENTGDSYNALLSWKLDFEEIAFEASTLLNNALLMAKDTLYALPSLEALTVVRHFLPDGRLEIPTDSWPGFLTQLLGWKGAATLRFPPEMLEALPDAPPGLRLYLQERDKNLVLLPAFMYSGTEVKWGDTSGIIRPKGARLQVINRDTKSEEAFLQMLRGLHTDIRENDVQHLLYLRADAVLADSWFFRFMEELRGQGVEVLGHDTLRTLRINTHRPQTRVQVSSGIDWFDTQIEIHFGDQHVTINEVKKALASRVPYVPLADGSLGMLPEEWLKKYALLLKVGEARGKNVRLKKFHFSVLDALLAEVDEEAVLNELEEKKEQLAQIIDRDFTTLEPPVGLDAELRPYQQAGYQWLAFLREAGWGGILADDMGLGKTVQALAAFRHYKNEHPDARFLVICPTTLMYNWEAEINKFTPGLTKLIHHGPKRSVRKEEFDSYDIVITTYGTARSDIKLLREYRFDYAVLDESQAIKNPQSQVAKAVLLLNTAHRLALSGTPVQNNTFDLYAQMNFLNPGLLGSREGFANDFATPIDKFGEDEVKQQLKQLTYPFILRRTKEQVAKDLPEKTEMILWCEMGQEQRKIYNAYRNSFKDTLLGMIDVQGMDRTQFHILQGLTKLRQICDSPAILNEEEKFPNHSVKGDELLRELLENIGNHKALVFSQFLGMLAIIRKELDARGVKYAYFDGGTSAGGRRNAVDEFQNDEDCRVFLISLKAGGIGLNLTAADYVYIVDPWWNPAVEQQAIDRTHRIGQTKNIFAYRLICKDTIEEKMLTLQERKRALAADLVSDDAAFLKKLSREDIAYLLS